MSLGGDVPELKEAVANAVKAVFWSFARQETKATETSVQRNCRILRLQRSDRSRISLNRP